MNTLKKKDLKVGFEYINSQGGYRVIIVRRFFKKYAVIRRLMDNGAVHNEFLPLADGLFIDTDSDLHSELIELRKETKAQKERISRLLEGILETEQN